MTKPKAAATTEAMGKTTSGAMYAKIDMGDHSLDADKHDRKFRIRPCPIVRSVSIEEFRVPIR